MQSDDAEVVATKDAREQALDLFEQSKALYRQGKFAEAATLLRQAHSLYPEPVLLYNLARALESMDELQQALAIYDEALDKKQQRQLDPETRASAERRRAALRRRQAEQRRLEAREAELERERREAAEALERERSARAQRPESDVLSGPVPWITLGVGAAGLVVGGGLLVGAHAQHDAAVKEPSQREAAKKQAGAERLQVASAIAFIAGGTLAAAGVTLLVLRPRESASHAALRLEVAPARVRVSAHF